MNKLIPLSLLLTFSNAAFSEDAPDPADVTRLMSSLQVYVGTNSNDNDLAVQSIFNVGGSFNKDNQFLTMLSATVAEKESAEQSGYENGMDLREFRARWYQVFGTGYEWLPKAGYSLDYLDQSNDDSTSIDNIVAVGAISKIPVLSNWSLFPNVAVVKADVNNSAKRIGMDDGTGMQLNLFNSIYLGKKGTYMMINPQYSYLDFDNVVTQDLLIETMIGTPLTDNKKWWLMGVYKETFSHVNNKGSHSSSSFKVADDKRQFRIGVTYYF